MRSTEPDEIVSALAILDTNAHTPATDPDYIDYADVHEFMGFVLKVTNGLNQAVTHTLYGNFSRSVTGADDYADTLTVAAGASGIIAWHGSRTAWTPWLFPSLQCSVAPTTGSVTVEIVKMDKMRD